jgi:membrane protein YqaA with SNARE-associated domain
MMLAVALFSGSVGGVIGWMVGYWHGDRDALKMAEHYLPQRWRGKLYW